MASAQLPRSSRSNQVNYSLKQTKLKYSIIISKWIWIGLLLVLFQNSLISQISVTATLGTPGPTAYTTLKSAFDAVNAGTHQGAITMDVTANTNEGATTAKLNASGSGSASYTSVLIRPSGGAARTITGSIAGAAVVDLNGADNVTINGLNTGGNSLTISNTSTSGTAETSTIKFETDATANVITNATILGSSTCATAANGGTIYFGASSSITGNDNNTISFCNIGPAGSNLPTRAVYSKGSSNTAYYNSGITISNNNIYDFFSATLPSIGIFLSIYNTEWTISSNKFYQTALRTQITGNVHAGIQFASSTINNTTISGNTIGYASANSTGVYTFSGVSGSRFYPIYFAAVGYAAPCNLQANIITQISMSGDLSGSDINEPFIGIFVSSGDVNIGTTSGNIIGSTSSANAITFSTTSTLNTEVTGIYFYSQSNAFISNNQIGGISVSGTASGKLDLFCLRAFTLTSKINSFQNNTIGFAAAPIVNNSTAVTSNTFGLFNRLGTASVTNNIIRYITAYSTNTGTGKTASLIGLYTDDATAVTPNTISQNTISNLQNLDPAAAVSVTGLYYYGLPAGANIVNRNLIHTLSSSSTNSAAKVNGILADFGTTSFRNNMIRLGTNISQAIEVSGINETVGTNNFYHNSIYIGGTPTSGSSNSYAFKSTVLTNTRNYRDNIFVNARSNSGATGKNYAITIAGTAPNPAGLTINNNLYYVNGSGAVFGLFNAADVPNLGAWKTAVGQDVGSYQSDPQFINPTAVTPDLHLNTSIITLAESNGADLGVTDDFDGQTRAGLTPVDIGADAGLFLILDQSPPIINSTPVNYTCSTGDQTISAVITDISGVPVMGSGIEPRIYYKKNALPYVSAAGVLSGGTYTNGTWTFTMSAAAMGGLAVGNVISYYIVAQDVVSPTPNISSNPSGVNSGTVNSHTPPSSPNTMTINVLNGTYLVGAGQSPPNFTTLSQAINAYNTACLSGPVVFELTDASYSTAETFPMTIIANPDASNTKTLTIRPASGVTVTITGSSATSLLKLQDADYVIVDGVNASGASLSMTNTAITVGTAVVWLSSSGVGNGASNNTLKNLTLKGGKTQNTGLVPNYGIYCGGTSMGSPGSGTTGEDNDGNIFTANTISKVCYGIFVRGGTTANPNTGNVITNNIIGPSSFGSDILGKGGVLIREQDGILISGNTIQYIGGDFTNAPSSSDRCGISLAADATWPPFNVLVRNAIITNNHIHDIVDERTYATVGINVGATDGTNVTNNLIANNILYNIKSNGTDGDRSLGIGLNGSNTDKIVFNSIYLTGDTDPNASASTPVENNAGILISNSAFVINPTIRNNIVYMDLSSSSAPTLKNACISVPTGYAWSSGSSNNNIFYYNPINLQSNIGNVGGTAGSYYLTLLNWQSALSQDLNSLSLNPQFISATNLHINTGVGTPVESTGVPVPGITTDFDGNTRNISTPDIGADEGTFIANANADIKPSAFITPAAGSYKFINNAFSPTSSFTNIGLLTQINVPVKYRIIGPLPATTVVYDQPGVIASINSGQTSNNVFPSVTIMTGGVYTIQAISSLPGDQVPSNDTISGTVNFIPSLCGTYHIGSAQLYPYNTLTNILSVLNATGVTCPVTLLLDDASYSVSETFPLTINTVINGSAINTVTIRPNTGMNPVIESADATAVFDINGGDHIIIDGSNNGTTSKNLTIRNTGNAPTIRLINDATFNVVKNSTLESKNSLVPSGTVFFSTTTGGLGNSNNTIQNCSIKDCAAPAGLPLNAIYSGGSASAPNASNTITLCYIYNWTNSGFNTSNIGMGNSWTLLENHFYQTSPRTSTLLTIVMNGGSGHLIANNFIGGSTLYAEGNYISTTLLFTGILLDVGTALTTSVQGNIIKNIRSTSAGNAPNYGIYLQNGTADIGTSNGNIIGSTIPGQHVELNGDTYAIRIKSTSTVNVSNNVITHFGTNANPSTGQLYSGIFSEGTGGNHTIANNNISYLTSNSAPSVSQDSRLFAIASTATGIQTIRGNVIHDVGITSTSTPTTRINQVTGITVTAAAAGSVVEKNTMYKLYASSLGTGNSGDRVYGIYSIETSNATYSNNMISLNGGNTADRKIIGIYNIANTGTTHNYYFNTVNIYGTASGTNYHYAFNRGQNATVNIKSNIFYNKRTGGTALPVAIANTSSAATGWPSTAGDYNVLFTTDQVALGQWLGSAPANNKDFNAWKAAQPGGSGGDAHSNVALINFYSATDVHITNSNFNLDNLGTPAGSITVDIDNEPRSGTTPDVGADEFNAGDCFGVIAGTATGSAIFCPSGTPVINAYGYTTGGNTTYQWMYSTNINNYPSGGSPVPGQTEPSELSTGVVSTTTYFWLKVTCFTVSSTDYTNLITIQAGPLPNTTLSPAGEAIVCTPLSSQVITSTTSAVSPIYQWYKDGQPIMSATNSSYTTTTPGTYALNVIDGISTCSSTSSSTEVTFNVGPQIPNVTPANPTICYGASPVLLTAANGTASNPVTVTGAGSFNSTDNFSPFFRLFEGSRKQYMIRASELQSLGLSAGSDIASVAFNVVQIAPPPINLDNFNIKIGATTLTDLSTTFASDVNVVYSSASYTPLTGINTFAFTTPFEWDGISNVVIEICFDNDPNGTCITNSPICWSYEAATVVTGTASFIASCEIHQDNQNQTRDMCSIPSAGNGLQSSTARPHMTLVWSNLNDITWSPFGPGSGLYTDPGGSIEYTGQNLNALYARPNSTTTYTVTATNEIGCTNTSTTTVNVGSTLVITNSNNGVGSLRDVIACAANGATITFQNNLIGQTISLTTGEIVIDKNLILAGPGIANLTLSGNNVSRIFNVLPGNTLEIRDVSLKNGFAALNGGAIWVQGSLILKDALLDNNLEGANPKSLTVTSPGTLTIIGSVIMNN